MGLKHHPRIVTDGLLTYFDTANTRSYSGSGTTVNGLVNGFEFTLINGVGFGTTGTNYFIFDGTNDNIPFSLTNYGTTLSIEMWAKFRSFSSNGMILGFNRYDIWTAGGAMGYNTSAADQYGLTSTQVTNLGLLNNWKHYIFEMRSDVSYTNNKIYVNGQNQSLSQVLSAENPSFRDFNNGNGRINCWLYDNNYFIPMDLSQFKIYNRALSQQEVLQNYNATKKRYGL
jgi:hypothetical protein